MRCTKEKPLHCSGFFLFCGKRQDAGFADAKKLFRIVLDLDAAGHRFPQISYNIESLVSSRQKNFCRFLEGIVETRKKSLQENANFSQFMILATGKLAAYQIFRVPGQESG